jgi:hypothetical protein
VDFDIVSGSCYHFRMMKRNLIILSLLFFTFFMVSPIVSADLEKSVAAAKRGMEPYAEQGDAEAQYNLGIIYGNEQNYKIAIKWYTLAAEQGHALSQFNLGEMYRNGEGVFKSYTKAVKLYRKAAEQVLPIAQNNLGVMYDYGQGVLQDYTRAHMWYNIAASKRGTSWKLAAKNRDTVAKKMTPAQITEAQDLARQCVKKKYRGC